MEEDWQDEVEVHGDTTGISAGMVAAKFVILFQQFMIIWHFKRATTSNITQIWDSDRLPAVTIYENVIIFSSFVFTSSKVLGTVLFFIFYF
jgi:hypothetical protein